MHLIDQHPTVCVFIGFWLFSAFADGMPAPTDRSGIAYIWLHNSLQVATGTLSKAIAVRYRSLAEVTIPKLQANAAGAAHTLLLFVANNLSFFAAKAPALQQYFAARFPLHRQLANAIPRFTTNQEPTMGVFLIVLQYAFALLPSIVTGIQTLVGDTQSGATKKQMATDMLSQALTGASAVTGGTNSALASLAASAALSIISATDAISTAVSHTKASGAYAAATKASAVNTEAIAKVALPPPAAAQASSAVISA